MRPGPKNAHSTVLSIEEEAIIVAFRRHTLLPLDDCLYALQVSIPHLTRSSLHRCLQRAALETLAPSRSGPLGAWSNAHRVLYSLPKRESSQGTEIEDA